MIFVSFYVSVKLWCVTLREERRLKVLRNVFVLKRREEAENWIMRSFMLQTLQEILTIVCEGDDMGRTCSIY